MSTLPPWGVAELPAPPAFTSRNVLRTIGPGVIGLGVAIGSGEWLLGPSIIVRYGPGLLWITTISVLLQVLLNLEMARYTMYTGEPIMNGYLRTRPGPTFWGWTYTALSFLQYGWPGWALASATASAALLLGRMPGEADAGFVILIGYVTFGACFAITLAGRKVEQTIEYVMWFMVAAIAVYLLAVDLFAASADSWRRVTVGFVAVGRFPEGVDAVLVGAFAAYSGLGGVGNAYITNWMRDKGFAMGGTVGYIPGAIGARDAAPAALPPHGNVFTVTPQSLERWRGWWRFVYIDQWLVFGLGSLLGMVLTAILTLEYVPPGTTISGWAVANLQASAIAARLGPAFWHLTLLCGFWILFSTQLGIVDGLPRATTDMLWSASPAARRRGDVRQVYYAVVAAFAVWGCIALNLAQPLTLIIIGANIAGVNLVLESLHTIRVNRRFLPPALRPPLWREAALVACALFFGTFALLALMATLR
ncbi:MAG: Nramp family divalent metal transporter [Vicinamibacterales bacterium]